MKWMIASDLHGSAYYCRKMLEAFDREQAVKMLLLGDILYHGPRNDLPRDYAPKEVIKLLNARRRDIISVRGNCDAQVDQMVLEFPILADCCVIAEDGAVVYATHGHEYNEGNLPPLHPGDVLLLGHSHVPKCGEQDGILCLNPGSVSIPKEGSWHGYMVLDRGCFLWKDLEGQEMMRYEVMSRDFQM